MSSLSSRFSLLIGELTQTIIPDLLIFTHIIFNSLPESRHSKLAHADRLSVPYRQNAASKILTTTGVHATSHVAFDLQDGKRSAWCSNGLEVGSNA